MANDYTSTTFYIDTNTDGDGLTTLKGGAPGTSDDLYVYSGAVLTITGSITLKAAYIGRSPAGVTSAGLITILAGAELALMDGASGGLFLDASGEIDITGAAGNKAGLVSVPGHSTFPLQKMDGFIVATDAEISNMDILCEIDGDIELIRTSMTIDMSSTSNMMVYGSLTLASSEILCANRWSCLNYGYMSMDIFSDLQNAYFALTYSGGSLIFLDDPDGFNIDWGTQMSRNMPLGGSIGRGRRLGRIGRTMTIYGTFSIANLSLWQTIQYYLTLNEIFKLTWSEGALNKCLFSKGNIKLSADDVGERPYNIELSEIA